MSVLSINSSPVRRCLLCLALTFASSAVATAFSSSRSNCTEPHSPFPERMSGKSYSRLDDCYRPRAESSLKVYRKSFLLTPFHGDPFVSCPPYYRLVVRSLPRNPYIISFPGITFDDYDQSKSCVVQQRAKRSKLLFPRGKNRARYAKILKEILAELEKISRFQCGETKDGFIIVKPGRNFEQVDVELVIGYVRTIAYMYDICLN